MDPKLLEIKNLNVSFKGNKNIVIAANKINLNLYMGETTALVGESGSGKSVTSLSINRLIPNPPGEIVGGQIIYNDTDLTGYKSLIYYVNDSDGDTIFFNDNLKEIKRVNPKKGKAVLFDSNILHCGSNPINTLNRVVINFIFEGNEKSILYR